MKFLTIMLLAMLLSSVALSKKPTPTVVEQPSTGDTTVYKVGDTTSGKAIERLPMFKGQPATQSFSMWCQQRVTYPQKAAYYGLEGYVVCSVIVEPDGSLSNINIVQGAHPLFNKEVLRVVKAYPRDHWEPATNNGKPMRFMFNIPVTFEMEKTISPPKQTQTRR